MVAYGPGTLEYHLCRAAPFLHFPGFCQAQGVGRVAGRTCLGGHGRHAHLAALPLTYYPISVSGRWNHSLRDPPTSAPAPPLSLMARGLRFLARTVHRCLWPLH